MEPELTAVSSEVPRNWAVGLLGIYQKILNYARTRKTQTALTAIATSIGTIIIIIRAASGPRAP
jgi:hypothetical protein